MIISQEVLKQIRDLVDQRYDELLIKVTNKTLADNPNNSYPQQDIMRLIYNYVFMNDPLKHSSPTTLQQLRNQQNNKPTPMGDVHEYSIFNANQSIKSAIDKLKSNLIAKIINTILQANEDWRKEALQNLDRAPKLEEKSKDKTIAQVAKDLRALSKEANRDWKRVATTEMANLIGIASTDRIVAQNQGKDLNTVYVYRITAPGNCKWCQKFYNVSGNQPKIYKLTELLSNGSNYGKRNSDWLPVVGATHPNTRTSQIVELKPGYAASPGGSQTFIGLESWSKYIQDNS